MKSIIKFFVLLFMNISLAQSNLPSEISVYQLTPGTKNNQLILELFNQSETLAANNIKVILVKVPSHLVFTSDIRELTSLQPSELKEIKMSFDVLRNINSLAEDTLMIIITGSDNILYEKSFIFNYTIPKEFKLEQNYPNPFNPLTKIRYEVPIKSKISLKVFDILGKEIMILVDQIQDAGYYEIDFNASGLSSGIYFSRLESDSFMKTIKMSLVK
ncbi:T9SS type A sorting domain-containing protein [Ignavibacterium album]|uniref:T9SS type A sorting domain-containing protein n=1 Tax=Ignavibacterium album TaxID=591197 RepID=UPI0026EAB733|nr:T9SS type A sorting domain-containing protein [Ignavibacterium album]